jgi:hypothetical protein
MISLSIKTYEIEPEHIIIGKNGKILSVVLFENKDGKGKYGDDGYVVQGVTKESREAGVRGKIIGNWRYTGQGASGKNGAAKAADKDIEWGKGKEADDDSSIPF